MRQSKKKRTKDDGFIDPDDEKRKVKLGIIAFFVLLIIFISLVSNILTDTQ